ncbi:acyltransferase family protein [Bifidobacterium magnum]|uniref:acyltransferase family protein n=1 Tax=Bifidobacterium magnum TaxID=1692 RepID=UPI002377EBAC|nr:acyltransferase family protein [Bifidobacterium magnum]
MELLRVVAMLMIIAHHHILHNPFNPLEQDPSLKQMAYVFLASLRKIGVVIFFGISAWFLCMDRNPSVRTSIKRAWKLEREGIFYGITLLCGYTIFDCFYPGNTQLEVSGAVIIKSLFPIITGVWWYITSYILFLLILPFLLTGLRKIGQKMHLALCSILFVVWGMIYGLFPKNLFGFPSNNIGEFIYLFILISYYRWYMNKISNKIACSMIAIGFSLIILVDVSGGMLYSLTGDSIFKALQNIYEIGAKLPVVLIGFGMVQLATTFEFHNSFINLLASTTLGVYMATEYPLSVQLFAHMFNIGTIYNSRFAVIYSIAAIVITFIIASLLDLLRQFIFHLLGLDNKVKMLEKLLNSRLILVWRKKILEVFDNHYESGYIQNN